MRRPIRVKRRPRQISAFTIPGHCRGWADPEAQRERERERKVTLLVVLLYTLNTSYRVGHSRFSSPAFHRPSPLILRPAIRRPNETVHCS